MNDKNTLEEVAEKAIISRRHILAGTAGIIGAGLLVAACGSDKKNDASTGSSTTATTTTAAKKQNVDLKVAGLAAGLEVLAVGTYKAALDAAGAKKLGAVPAAVGEFVTTAMKHHQAHLDAWNKVITGAGGTAVTAPNATLKPTVDSEFAKVTDIPGVAKLALNLEQIAAATYLSAQNLLTSKDAIQLAGSIQIVDAQHAAILLYVLGEYPVPDVFAKTDLAAA